MKIQFIDKIPQKKTLILIAGINKIIGEYFPKGLKLTLRQLYYQFVARGWLPNTEVAYKRLRNAAKIGREIGVIDWDAIEDRSRNVRRPLFWDDFQEALDDLAERYRIDLWANQEYRVEVWIEKEALIGVIEGVCLRLRLPHFACKGFVSVSEIWDTGYNRLRAYLDLGQTPVVLYLGDHDPSGWEMSADVQRRLDLFAGTPIQVDRIALNMDQIEEHKPPPNPAKKKDSRFPAYAAEFGDESWELDALPTDVLTSLIEDHVAKYRDDDLWDESLEDEKSQREDLRKLLD